MYLTMKQKQKQLKLLTYVTTWWYTKISNVFKISIKKKS